MEVTPAAAALPTAAAPALRVLGGNLATVPIGELLQAVVTKVANGAATLTVNGEPLTVRAAAGMTPGATLFVRTSAGPNPGLEVLGRVRPGSTAATPPTPATPPPSVAPGIVPTTAQPVVTTPKGSPGNQPLPVPPVPTPGAGTSPPGAARPVPTHRGTTPADTAPTGRDTQSLAAAGTPVAPRPTTGSGDPRIGAPPGAANAAGGIGAPTHTATNPEVVTVGRPPLLVPIAPAATPVAIAAAVLRSAAPPDLAPALWAVRAELAAAPPALAPAAAEAQTVIRALIPNDGSPPDADRLRALVSDGGLHHEAKLARAADSGRTPDPAPDVKGGLLRVLRAASELGTTLPAARAALDGIEAQQAAAVLARENGTPVVLQIPFPDRDGWRTLNLAIDPDRPPADEPDAPPDGFRLLLHVPLSGLGETWVDAALGGDRFRAVVYLDNTAAREHLNAGLPELRAELADDGFKEVLLDVRAAAELPAARRRAAAVMRAGRTDQTAVLDVRA